MSLILIDGFDHYGDDETKMTEGVYEQVGSEFSISSTNPRTGAKCIRRSTAVSDGRIIFDLQEDKETIAIGMAIYPSALPSADSAYAIFSLVDSNDADNITFIVDQNGSIKAVLNDVDGMEVITTGANIIQASEYQHIEIAVRADTSDESSEVIQTIDENFENGLDDYTLVGANNYSVSGDQVTITGDGLLTDSFITRTFSLGTHTLIAVRFDIELRDTNLNDIGIMLVRDQNGATIFQFFPRVASAVDATQRASIISQTNFITSSALNSDSVYSFSGQFTESGLVYELLDSLGNTVASGTDTTSTAERTLGQLIFRSDNDSGTPAGGEKALYSNVEFDIQMNIELESDGIIEIRHNGVTVASGSSLDTTGTNIQSYRKVSLRLGSASAFGVQTDVDDYFIWDDQGVWNNSFLGDRRCYFLKPNGDTNIADFDPSSGSLGYKMIDDDSPDDDLTYIIAEALLQTGSPRIGTSEFEIESLPSGSSLISGLNVVARAAKTDSTSAEIYTSINSGADSLSAEAHTLTTSYRYYNDIYEYDPGTIASLTKDSFNVMSVSVTADDLDPGIIVESPTVESPSFESPTGAAIPTDYVALWTMDNISGATLVDESSNNNDGTISGATQVPGYIDNALQFDGLNDEVNVPHSSSLNFGSLTSSYSGSFWFKTSGAVGSDETLTAKFDAAAPTSTSPLPFLVQILSTGAVRIGFRDTDAVFRTVTSTGTSYDDTSWHHVYFRRDHVANTILLCIDNSDENESGVVIDASMANNSAVTMGYLNNDGTKIQFFDGLLDQYYLFNRVLTSEERTALFNEI